MPGNDAVQELIDAAYAAGDIAKGYFKSDPATWDKGDDAGPVTEADLAVDEMLRARLTTRFPEHAWLSEETDDDLSRLDNNSVIIVDPIDGTRAFIEGNAHWSHSLALCKNGAIVAAAVYLPVNDLMFSASLGGGAYLNGHSIKVSDAASAAGACVLSNKANFQASFWPGGIPDMRRSFRSSLAYRLCLVGEGAFDGMVTLRPTWEWDVAAGSLIAAEAGASVTDQRGNRPIFNSPKALLDGMVAATPKVHGDMMVGLATR